MKLKENFVLRQVAQYWVVLPLADEVVDFSGMLTLNDSGVMLWNVLENNGDRDAMVAALTSEYDVSDEQAKADVDEFIEKLVQIGCIDQ